MRHSEETWDEERERRMRAGFIELPQALRRILAEWDSFDDDLKDHYAEELLWVLRNAPAAAVAPAGSDGVPDEEVQAARAALLAMSDEVEKVFGFRPEGYLRPRKSLTSETGKEPTSP
jgi:hypothetical protein